MADNIASLLSGLGCYCSVLSVEMFFGATCNSGDGRSSM